jgi:hypothetical protein
VHTWEVVDPLPGLKFGETLDSYTSIAPDQIGVVGIIVICDAEVEVRLSD